MTKVWMRRCGGEGGRGGECWYWMSCMHRKEGQTYRYRQRSWDGQTCQWPMSVLSALVAADLQTNNDLMKHVSILILAKHKTSSMSAEIWSTTVGLVRTEFCKSLQSQAIQCYNYNTSRNWPNRPNGTSQTWPEFPIKLFGWVCGSNKILQNSSFTMLLTCFVKIYTGCRKSK